MRATVQSAAEVRKVADIAALNKQWQALATREQRTLAEIRLEKGKLLREARKAFPLTGRGAGGWAALLEQWKVTATTAARYMQLAGYVDENPPTVGDFPDEEVESERVPTYQEAGVTRRDEPPSAFPVLTVPADMALAARQGPDWAEELERIAEKLRTHSKSLFSCAEDLESICREQGAVIASPALLTVKSMLIAASGSIEKVLSMMGDNQ